MDKHRGHGEVPDLDRRNIDEYSNPSGEFGTDLSSSKRLGKPTSNLHTGTPSSDQDNQRRNALRIPFTVIEIPLPTMDKVMIGLQRLWNWVQHDRRNSAEDIELVEMNLGPPGIEDGHPLPTWRFALLGLGLSLGLFMAMLDTSIVATCLYSIAAEFETMESVNWVALSYTLSYLGCAVLLARISDIIGRRAAVMISFFIFVVFSLACGLATTLTQLIVFRGLQGIGGSGLYSLAIIIFPEMTPNAKKKYIAMIIGLVIATSGVLGPLLGGVITQYASWRWVFWLNCPIGAVSASIFWISWPLPQYLPRTERRQWKDLDYVGTIALIAASVLVVYAFQSAGADTGIWSKAVFIAPLVIGIFCILFLLSWSSYIGQHKPGKVAAVPLVLMTNRVYFCGAMNTMLLGFPYLLCVFTFPLRFQVVYRKSALQAGLMLLPMLGSSAIGSVLSSPLNSGSTRSRLFVTLLAATLFMFVGCILQAIFPQPTESVEPMVLGFLVLIGFGFGLSTSTSTMLAVAESPVREHASAQSIIAQLRVFGGSIGIAASTSMLNNEMHSLRGILSPAQLSNLAASIGSLTPNQARAVRTAYTHAMKMEMFVCAGILVVAKLITLGVRSKEPISLMEAIRRRDLEEEQRLADMQQHPPP